MCESAIKTLQGILDTDSLVRLRNAAGQAQALENEWVGRLSSQFERVEAALFERLEERGVLDESVIDFLPFYAEHSLEAMYLGYMTAYTREQTQAAPFGVVDRSRLTKNPRLPRNLGKLMELYDEWRKKKRIPLRQRKIAEKVRQAYIRKVRQAWGKYSKEYREGDVATRDRIREEIQKQGRTTYARAKQITQTETTHYYNRSRRQVYDSSPDVTHYLFVPIRDAATTEWCNTRRGVVYTKGTDYLRNETPPVHWNCRSELLPLTPQNPSHRKLIENQSLRRERRRPAPLPPGWNNRLA